MHGRKSVGCSDAASPPETRMRLRMIEGKRKKKKSVSETSVADVSSCRVHDDGDEDDDDDVQHHRTKSGYVFCSAPGPGIRTRDPSHPSHPPQPSPLHQEQRHAFLTRCRMSFFRSKGRRGME